MTLSWSERCLADRASSCRTGAWCACCVSLTLAEGSAQESLPKTDLPGSSSHKSQLSRWASLCLPPPSFPLLLASHPSQSSRTSVNPTKTKNFERRGKPAKFCTWTTAVCPSPQCSEVELIHPEQALLLASSHRPQRRQGGSTQVPAIPEMGLSLLHCLYASNKQGGLGRDARPTSFHPCFCELSQRFQGCGLHLLFPVGFVTLPAPQVSGCQCLSPGWLGLCYFVLKPVCFFNGYK